MHWLLKRVGDAGKIELARNLKDLTRNSPGCGGKGRKSMEVKFLEKRKPESK